MTRKVYRTAQGRMVDLGALQLKNEHVRAVGNMKVNARGDKIDSNNRPIESRNQQVSRQYRRQVTNTNSAPVSATATDVEIPATPEDFDDDFHRPVQEVPKVETRPEPKAEPEPKSSEAQGHGLAAAIAKARQVKQEPLKTPKQIAQQTPGVRKI